MLSHLTCSETLRSFGNFRELHGQAPVVTQFNRQNLQQFEMASRKGEEFNTCIMRHILMKYFSTRFGSKHDCISEEDTEFLYKLVKILTILRVPFLSNTNVS